ncbi:MAG: type IV pilus secretin PilQ [Thermodesulfobacteriota bacterium]|nr:type IV pilus secretin PilQ [Thermodesulfobacteriota bacterium]
MIRKRHSKPTRYMTKLSTCMIFIMLCGIFVLSNNANSIEMSDFTLNQLYLKSIDLSQKDEKSIIKLVSDKPIDYTAYKFKDIRPRVIIELNNMGIDENMVGLLPVEDKIVKWISASNVKSEDKLTGILEILLNDDYKHFVSVEPESLTITFVPEIAKTDKESSLKREEVGGKRIGFGKERIDKIYSGRKISIDVIDGEIQNILRFIAEFSNLNIVIADSVKGKVTLKLKNVPWDQALDTILQLKGLGKQKIGNVMRIAPLSVLEKEVIPEVRPEELEAFKPLVTATTSVNFADIGDIEKIIQDMLTKRGKVTTDQRTGSLIIKDIEENIMDALELIRELDTPTPQVSIEAKIVAIESSYSKELGIQWGTNYIQSVATGTETGQTFPNEFMITGGLTTEGPWGSNYIVNMPATVGAGHGGAIGFSFVNIEDSLTLEFRLSALEDIGKARVISNPKVTTINNEEAVIKQGKEVPYQTVSQDGTQTQFKEVVLSLQVTPHITPDNNIVMEISIKNDTVAEQTSAGPALNKQEIDTEVLVADGQTVVMGGIFKELTTDGIAQVPWFSKIPILGLLFKSKRATESTTELILFITPKVIPLSSS